MKNPESFLIRRGLDLLLVAILAKALGPVDSLAALAARVYELPEISQVGVITLTVVIVSETCTPLFRFVRRSRQRRMRIRHARHRRAAIAKPNSGLIANEPETEC